MMLFDNDAELRGLLADLRESVRPAQTLQHRLQQLLTRVDEVAPLGTRRHHREALEAAAGDPELRELLEELRETVAAAVGAAADMRQLLARINALALPDDRLPRWTLDEAREYIGKVYWQFAVTMPTI